MHMFGVGRRCHLPLFNFGTVVVKLVSLLIVYIFFTFVLLFWQSTNRVPFSSSEGRRRRRPTILPLFATVWRWARERLVGWFFCRMSLVSVVRQRLLFARVKIFCRRCSCVRSLSVVPVLISCLRFISEVVVRG